jgi:hypothetical protein
VFSSSGWEKWLSVCLIRKKKEKIIISVTETLSNGPIIFDEPASNTLNLLLKSLDDG